MNKNRRKHSNNNWNNQKKNDQQFKDLTKDKSKVFQFNHSAYEDLEAEKEQLKAIAQMKAREVICPMCNQPITEIASAINDKASGKPAHFDCVLTKVKESEPTGENEKISYIGQGRFAVLYYENPRDQRNFSIKKIIEWENRENKSEWREEISELYSKIK